MFQRRRVVEVTDHGRGEVRFQIKPSEHGLGALLNPLDPENGVLPPLVD